MAKRTLKSEAMTISSTAVDIALASVSLASAAALVGGESVIPVPVLLAGTVIPAYQLIRRNWPQSYAGKSTRQQLRNMASTVDDYLTPRYSDDEFYFRGLGLPVSVPESTFYRFVSIARRRQTNAIYGSKYTRQWTGRTYRQIKINWVLSEGYFTNEVRPRFLTDEYWSCMRILRTARLLERKGQGDAGHLVGDYGVGWYVARARTAWDARLYPTPRPYLSNLLSNFTTRKRWPMLAEVRGS